MLLFYYHRELCHHCHHQRNHPCYYYYWCYRYKYRFYYYRNNESVRFHLKTSQLFLSILSFSFFNSRFTKKNDDDYNLHIYIYIYIYMLYIYNYIYIVWKRPFLYRFGLILFLLSLISGKAEHQYKKTQ